MLLLGAAAAVETEVGAAVSRGASAASSDPFSIEASSSWGRSESEVEALLVANLFLRPAWGRLGVLTYHTKSLAFMSGRGIVAEGFVGSGTTESDSNWRDVNNPLPKSTISKGS